MIKGSSLQSAKDVRYNWEFAELSSFDIQTLGAEHGIYAIEKVTIR
jgi:hypothetical protein